MAHNSSVETIKPSSHSFTFLVLKGGKMSWHDITFIVKLLIGMLLIGWYLKRKESEK